MKNCELCPRNCGADRSSSRGVCRVGKSVKIARAAPHYGEEPCISGNRGSGAVFFSGCPLGCVFCQNYKLSRGLEGSEISVERLAEIFTELERSGVHNLNLVTGTQFVPQIIDALEMAKPSIPVVWNSSGYEKTETIDALAPYVSVWMPDLKYALSEPAKRYSKAPDYPQIAKKAIRRMVELADGCEFDGEGMLLRGVVLRHLVLPGQTENSRRVIRWVDREFLPGELLFSLMAQYTPCGAAEKYPEINRTLSQEEWDSVLEELDSSGIEDGYVQELSAAGEEQIPSFDGTGVNGEE